MFHKATCLFRLKSTFLGAALLLGIGAAAPLPPAHATSVNSIKQSIENLWQKKGTHQHKARKARNKAAALKAKAGTVHVRLEKTQQLLLKANSIYENYHQQIKQTEAHIVKTRHRKQIITKRYNRHLKLFGQRLAAMQKARPMSYLEVLLGAHTFSDLSRRVYLLNAILDRDAHMQSQLKSDKAQITELQNSLMAQWQQRNKQVQAANEEKKRIYLAEQKVENYWKEIKSSQYEQWAYVQAQEKASKDIATMINTLHAKRVALIRQERRRRQAQQRRAASTNKRSSSVDYSERMKQRKRHPGKMTEDFQESGGSGGGGWKVPVQAPISSPFGMRYHPILHRRKLHTGDDLAASYGTPFHAAKSGTVIYAGWQTAYGNMIIIDNGNGLSTLYGHASKLAVSVGEHVRAGQYIGNVGSTGWSTGSHLHFEVRKNGHPVNPMPYLKRAGYHG